MAPQNQLIGIIEIDADPASDATTDDTFGATLRQIRRAAHASNDHDTDESTPCSADSFCYWDEDEEAGCECVVVMTADLHQLHTDLENELARFIDRLLAAS